MGYISIGEINLNVPVNGHGYPVILLHGLGRNHTQFDTIVKKLAKNYQIITPDCRGHGQSDKPAAYTLQDHVADILGIMDYYKMETASLLGISGGSYIAQAVAIAAKDRITKLILTVPKSNGLSSSMQQLTDLYAEELEAKQPKDKAFALLKPHFTYDAEAIKKHEYLFKSDLTPEQFAAADKALSSFDFRRGLPEITAKTLVISGKYDGLNPPSKGKEIARLIPNSTYIEMQYSGHLPMLEEPEVYLKIIENFMLGSA